MNYFRMVEDLTIEHRHRPEIRALMEAGPLAADALRWGLHHKDPAVRVGCCVVLDHYLDERALPDLTANLDHPNEEVRAWALHALACDRCKEGECRPEEENTMPIALKMLRDDQSRRVRAQAVHMLGPSAGRAKRRRGRATRSK